MKKISLTKGGFALVDDEDFERVSQLKWASILDRNVLYAQNHKDYLPIRMHRFILSASKGQQIDHINGDGLDNRKENLRICTTAENGWNQRVRKDTGSGFKGVSWNKASKRWVAYICKHKKTYSLGYFIEKEDAIAARLSAEKKHYGEFARPHNYDKH